VISDAGIDHRQSAEIPQPIIAPAQRTTRLLISPHEANPESSNGYGSSPQTCARLVTPSAFSIAPGASVSPSWFKFEKCDGHAAVGDIAISTIGVRTVAVHSEMSGDPLIIMDVVISFTSVIYGLSEWHPVAFPFIPPYLNIHAAPALYALHKINKNMLALHRIVH
jgi:hypothetical protein